jgi:hypothetical protein
MRKRSEETDSGPDKGQPVGPRLAGLDNDHVGARESLGLGCQRDLNSSKLRFVRKNHGTFTPGIVGTPEQWRWVRNIVFTILALNLADAVLTLLWVSRGLAREANPLLRHLITTSPLLFVAVKVALVGLGSWLLWRLRRRPFAVVAIFIAFLAYYWLLVYHIGFLSVLSTRFFLG